MGGDIALCPVLSSKIKLDNRGQKVRKSRYQVLLLLLSPTRFVNFVSISFPGIE